MHRTVMSIVILLPLVLLCIAGCGKKQGGEQQQGTQTQLRQGPSNAVAGIHWSVPPGWQEQGARTMRVATYSIPAAGGDSEAGECAVFFFGRGEGGDIESNIGRWSSQFENPGRGERSTRMVDGMTVTVVKISGTYLSPGGPMMQSQGKKPNYKLLGAIVEAPDGSVFFKFTGPAKTVDAAEKDFNAMIGSITKEQRVS